MYNLGDLWDLSRPLADLGHLVFPRLLKVEVIKFVYFRTSKVLTRVVRVHLFHPNEAVVD